MATILDARYRINGLLATEKTAMANMEQLCNAAGCWLTYDIHDGKWAFVINKAGTSVSSFDDSNIIGAITVSGTGLTDLYNKVKVEFPHRDLRDQTDYVEIEIPGADRNANEPDNTLNIKYDIINDPVQAELLGFIELKQSRVDKVIKFQTDFSKIGLKAGDIIDVTNTIYGFSSKLFRIVSIAEQDTDEGNIVLDITALEYDANVYDESDLYRYERTNSNGIRAIGSIDTPSTPTLTAFAANARPHILLEATSPDGTVNEIEYWISKDNSTFTYVGSTTPKGNATFTSGEQVEFDYDQGTSGNIYARVRAKNSTSSSEFSSTANLVYSPVQTTQAVNTSTEVKDGSGNILTALALTTLLSQLDGFFGGNSTDSMYSQIFNNLSGDNQFYPSIYSGAYKVTGGAGAQILPYLFNLFSVPEGQTSTSLATYDPFMGGSLICPVSGSYFFRWEQSWLHTGASGSENVYFRIRVKKNGITQKQFTSSGTFNSVGITFHADAFSVTAGDVITVDYDLQTTTPLPNWGHSFSMQNYFIANFV